MEGEGAAQAGLWMVVPFSATSLVEADQRQQEGLFLAEVGLHHQDRFPFGGGEGVFTGPHRPHFSYCKSNVFPNVGRAPFSDRFPECIIPFATKRGGVVASLMSSTGTLYREYRICNHATMGATGNATMCYWYPRAYLTEF